jgi:6-pyruvoyltetrahydropterin/6-carboxytetrahydropterin synthase
MTVFPDGSKERLHGHNFYLSVVLELADVSLPNLVDFGPVKEEMSRLCEEWKEHTLLPGRCPHFRIEREVEGQLEFTLCGDRYRLPARDALILPVDNVSVEALAALAADSLAERLKSRIPKQVVLALEVTVEESPGQGASCLRWLERAKA